jgi:glycine/D-amino acid oxidase-like deaminating enzyme
MIFDTKRVLFYFRRTFDDRILFGGRASFSPTDARRSATVLRQGLASVFPELAGARIDFTWSGSVGFTFDLLPHLGVLDGVHYALGYCGHGVAMGTYLGHQAALLAADRPPDSPFLGLDFPARFFYRRRPWFMPLAGGYFHLMDRLPL